ncbi:MAG TPA: hypothetical protein VKY86_07365 [Promicromonospora sp.]|nr:hypothetical protein [Promicromonospora sp.]
MRTPMTRKPGRTAHAHARTVPPAPRPGRRVAARLAGAAALLALAVAACTPPPPPPADPLVARADGGASPSETVVLAPGEWADFELVLDAVRHFDLVYAELDTTQPAVVELRGGNYWTAIASSDTPDFFVRGTIAGVPQPRPAAARLDPNAIGYDLVCRGPCVIFRPTSQRFFLRVVNTGGTLLDADVFLYGMGFADEHEPDNDRMDDAPPLADGETGALELLGDTDFWYAPVDANVTFVPNSGGLALQASVFDACGLSVAGPFDDGTAFRVFAGETVRVRAAQDRAGPPGRSGYTVLVGAPTGGTPPRDPGCRPATANLSPNTPVVTQFMGSGATATFVVTVPAGVRSRDVIQFEVGGSARLEVLSSGGSVLFSSTSPDVFFAGGAASMAPEVAPSAVAANRVCGGPCVIVPSPASSYLVRVRNTGSARNVPLYAFGRAFDDRTEPANDARSTAPSIVGDGSGAIETVGDVDLWLVPFTGQVAFDAVSGGPALQAHVLSPQGAVVDGPYAPGSTFEVFAGEFVRVRAADPNRAAVAGRSTYFLD